MTQFVHGLNAPEWHPVENIGDEEIPPHGVMVLYGGRNETLWLTDLSRRTELATTFFVRKPEGILQPTAYSQGVYMVNSGTPIPVNIGRLPLSYGTPPRLARPSNRNGRGWGSFAANPTIVKVDIDFDDVTTPSPTFTSAEVPGYSAGLLYGSWSLTPGQPGFRWVGTGSKPTGQNSTERVYYFIQDFTGRKSFWGTVDAHVYRPDETTGVISVTHGPGGSDTGVDIGSAHWKNPLGLKYEVGDIVFLERYDGNTQGVPFSGFALTRVQSELVKQGETRNGHPGTLTDEVNFLAKKGALFINKQDASAPAAEHAVYVCKDPSEGAADWERLALYSDLHDESHSH